MLPQVFQAPSAARTQRIARLIRQRGIAGACFSHLRGCSGAVSKAVACDGYAGCIHDGGHRSLLQSAARGDCEQHSDDSERANVAELFCASESSVTGEVVMRQRRRHEEGPEPENPVWYVVQHGKACHLLGCGKLYGSAEVSEVSQMTAIGRGRNPCKQCKPDEYRENKAALLERA